MFFSKRAQPACITMGYTLSFSTCAGTKCPIQAPSALPVAAIEQNSVSEAVEDRPYVALSTGWEPRAPAASTADDRPPVADAAEGGAACNPQYVGSSQNGSSESDSLCHRPAVPVFLAGA